MSNVAVFCRRFRSLMQAWYSSPVRGFCQNVSREELNVDVPSDPTTEASSDDTVGNDSSIDNGSEADASVEMMQRINELSATTGLGRVSAAILGRIADHRATHGPFQRPEDLLAVPGVGRQTLRRISAEILRPSLRVELGRTGGPSSQGGEPFEVPRSRIESLTDIVAVDVGLKHLGWVHMTRDRRVWQWKVNDLVGISASKWDPPTYQRMITSALSEMPQPDVFVLEHQPFTAANKSTFQTLLFQRTLQGMLYASLNAGLTGTPRAVSIPQARVGRHFDLQVGARRASGQEIVAGFLRDSEAAAWSSNDDDDDLSARVDQEGAAAFRSATKHQREHLANCLLQAVAFYDLVVDRIGLKN